MLRNLFIKIDRTHFAYGQLNGSLKKPLVILVHGLGSSMNESLIHDAAAWFAKHGYSTFRFNLYSWQKGARQLKDSTLKNQASDVDAIVRHFRRKGVKKIYLAGHSYGGPTILLSKDRDFDAVTLWDPSYKIQLKKGKYAGRLNKSLNGYVMHTWGINVLIGKRMVEEAESLKWNELATSFDVPLQIISAGNGEIISGAKRYIRNASEPKLLVVLKGATHHFDDREDMHEEVYRLTKAWFDRF